MTSDRVHPTQWLQPSYPSETPQNKRRRTAQACVACRTKKSRCDGKRPVCTTCTDLGYDCSYAQSSSSANVIVGKEYLSGLETRLGLVENDIRSIKHSSIAATTPGTSHSRLSALSTTPEDTAVVYARNNDADVELDDRDASEDPFVEGVTDGMGVTFADEEDSGFFGPTSNTAFMRHTSAAAKRVSDAFQPRPQHHTLERLRMEGSFMHTAQVSSSVRPRMSASQAHKVDIYALPSHEEALQLLDQYFRGTGLVFPYLDEEKFLAAYAEARLSGFRTTRKTWLGLLNMVLALATTTSLRSDLVAETRFERSDVYYRRALGLCEKQMMRGTSLEIVQFLLVMGQYLQGTQKSVQAWTTHGLAVKAALQLGLHSKQASRKFSPLDREIRKRTWYGCVILDRTLSMTFGRPQAIPDSYVQLDLPLAYETAQASLTADPSPKSAGVDFYTATITLCRVVWNVVDQLYGGNIGCDEPTPVIDSVTRILQLEQQLREWESDLPTGLTLRRSNDIPQEHNTDYHVLERLNVILTLRFHHLKILLHRPILVRFLDCCGEVSSAQHELALLQHIGSNSTLLCVQSAEEIISIVSTVVHSEGRRREYLGAWWFSLYYTFNAALVIFASSLIYQHPGPALPLLPPAVGQARKSLDEAATALEALDRGNRLVEKCTAYLKKLSCVLDVLSRPTSATAVLDKSIDPAHQVASKGSTYHPQSDQQNRNTRTMSEQNHSDPAPLGMDLGEFMSMDDMAFLDSYTFPFEQPGPGTDFFGA